MANTWTCARCAAPNDEAVAACASCGATRGAAAASEPAPPEAPRPPAASWAAGPPAPGPSTAQGADGAGALPPPAGAPGGWPGAPVAAPSPSPGGQIARGVLATVGARLLVIVAFLAVTGVIGWFTMAGRDENGNITKAGEVAATELKVGDCYDLQGGSASLDPNQPISKTDGRPCTQSHHYEVFYVGTIPDHGAYPTEDELQAWAESACVPAFEAYVGTSYDASALTIAWFVPDEAGWSNSDRGGQCSLVDPGDKAFTTSLRDSRQ